MKRIHINGLLLLFLILSACSNGQNTKYNLSVNEFNDKLNSSNGAQLVDVRTPEEFQGGHLPKALNYNWNGDAFSTQIKNLNKQKPVFVYCLSGGRSASAAASLRTAGFNEVYEMNGGMMKWRAAGLPETTDNNAEASKGMSINEYNKLTESHKKVLIDFYAEWCKPCQKMKPYLEEISKEMSSEVKVVRIDADQNKSLLQTLKIDALPVLIIYENGAQKWRNDGYIDKASVLTNLK